MSMLLSSRSWSLNRPATVATGVAGGWISIQSVLIIRCFTCLDGHKSIILYEMFNPLSLLPKKSEPPLPSFEEAVRTWREARGLPLIEMTAEIVNDRYLTEIEEQVRRHVAKGRYATPVTIDPHVRNCFALRKRLEKWAAPRGLMVTPVNSPYGGMNMWFLIEPSTEGAPNV